MKCAQRQEILEFITKIIKDIQLPIVHNDEGINFNKQLDVFKILCKMNFDRKPLYFAQKSIRYLNELKTFEESLINIIEKIHINRNDGTTEEIPDITEDNLLEEATKLIKLQAEDRSKKCGDEIIIEIPVEELRDIESWDIPGFDENMVIDRRLNEIIKDPDVIFGLIPNRNYELTQQQSFAATSEEEVDHQKIKLIENEECESLVCFLITTTDKFTIDKQTKKSKSEVVQNLFNKLKSQLKVKLVDDATASNRFIPMCTHYTFSVKDYLESRLSFIEKSTTWFDLAVKLITSYRLDYLIQSLHILLDYDDFNRMRKRYEKLQNMLNPNGLKRQLYDQIAIEMELIHKKIVEIDISTLIIGEFYAQLDLNPIDSQSFVDTLDRLIVSNPYSTSIRLNDTATAKQLVYLMKESDNTLRAGWIACVNSIQATDNEQLRQKNELTNSISNDVSICTDEIINQIERTIYEYLTNSIDVQIDKILNAFQNKSNIAKDCSDENVKALSKFMKKHRKDITKLYLDIIDKHFTYSYSKCEITNEKLGKANYEVFNRQMTINKTDNIILITAKEIPLNDFNVQEVRYIKELQHDNIVKYYGIKRCCLNDDNYYIIMECMDCNLLTYLHNRVLKNDYTVELITNMLIQITNGLYYLHKSEFIHRDIKAGNILVREENNE
ncbi:unnamed protein product [Didymodactylos carnosus]|nr:unnamed protein product [Didymodactylos carnosus]CAF3593532.1 unnamed protein product [Didymodactylos carnosus]